MPTPLTSLVGLSRVQRARLRLSYPPVRQSAGTICLAACCCLAVFSVATSTLKAAEHTTGLAETAPKLKASMHTDRPVLMAGKPVWVVFTVTNLTDEPVKLEVPEAMPGESKESQGIGLPLDHVFSGAGFTALHITDERGTLFGDNVMVEPVRGVAPIVLAPSGSVGVRLELTRYYDALTRPGNYKLVWRPYGGSVQSEPLEIALLPEQQAVLVTDFGSVTLRFYYEQAPEHVRNFIELVRAGFYDGLTFHRVVPGGIIQGGDPLGDGRGGRPDGKRLRAEFSDIPFELGTVGMARLEEDPDSASCQFFVCLSRQPAFDGKQTAFARVVGSKSFDVLRQIAATPTGPKNRPVKPVYIRAISLENVPERERELVMPVSRGVEARPAGRVIHGPNGVRLLPPVQARGEGTGKTPTTRVSGTASRPASDAEK